MDIHLFPSAKELEVRKNQAADYMAPSDLPYAVVLEGVLSSAECETIRAEFMGIDPHRVPHCNAETREKIGAASSLTYVYALAKFVNDKFWQYELNEKTAAWMQTYNAYDDYQLHMDGSPGQMRKLTAVVLLTDPELYSGGNLVLCAQPAEYTVPKTQGTIAFFLPWLLHRVDRVFDGTRQTINLGYWGPPFR